MKGGPDTKTAQLMNQWLMNQTPVFQFMNRSVGNVGGPSSSLRKTWTVTLTLQKGTHKVDK